MADTHETGSLPSVEEDLAPLPVGRRVMMRLALGLGLLPLLAACHQDDDDDDDDGDLGATISDRKLKENINRIGTTAQGLPFYSFSYIGQSSVYAGVMAQDVLAVMPEAVHLSDSGYYSVDYRKLGLRMLRLQ